LPKEQTVQYENWLMFCKAYATVNDELRQSRLQFWLLFDYNGHIPRVSLSKSCNIAFALLLLNSYTASVATWAAGELRIASSSIDGGLWDES